MRQTLSAPNLWPHIVKYQEALTRQGTQPAKVISRKQSSTGFRENYRSQKVSSKIFNEFSHFKNEEESIFFRIFFQFFFNFF